MYQCTPLDHQQQCTSLSLHSRYRRCKHQHRRCSQQDHTQLLHKGRHLMSEEVGDERDAGCKQGNSVIGILWLEGSCDGWQRGMGDSEQVSK
jgi:hypothetical protein